MPATKTLYDTDFNLWLSEQLQLLREERLGELDVANLIEELESLGKSDKRALTSHLKIALQHMLKWDYQPEKQSGSWVRSIVNSRSEILLILEDSPSLQNFISEAFTKAYTLARKDARDETGLPLSTFPEQQAYTFEQVMEWKPD